MGGTDARKNVPVRFWERYFARNPTFWQVFFHAGSAESNGYLQPGTKGEFRVDADLDLGPAAFFGLAVEATGE